jgi:hypothetical protein
MRIDQRRVHILVTEQFLDRPNVIAILQQMRREAVPERVAARPLSNAGTPHGIRDTALYRALM